MGNESRRKFAVITGASSGIGFELAKECLVHDYDIMICAEDAGIVSAATTLADARGTIQAVRADLATPEGVEELYQAIVETHRPVDALILNAGVGVGGAFINTSLADEMNMIMLNCCHTVHLAKRVIPDLVARGQGQVMITGSVVSTSPNPYQAVYGATKAFVMSFGEAIRHELQNTGVTVTVLQPDATDTNFFNRANLMHTKVGQANKEDPAVVARDGFEAMVDGKDTVLATGFTSKAEDPRNEILPATFDW